MSKAKHFRCTECGRESDHLTTRWDKDGKSYLFEDEAMCKWCFNKRRKEAISNGERVMQQFASLSPEERDEILAMLGSVHTN
jgi:hypothetical protein